MASVEKQGGIGRVTYGAGGPNLDAFFRLRVSNPETLFDSKQIHFDNTLIWDDQETSGTGTSSTWDQDTASSTLAVSATTAGTRIRQTRMRFNYQPGKSQLVELTGVLQKSGGGAGITRGIGYYEGNNGFAIVDKEGTVNIRKTSYVTGSAVDTDVAQSSWNYDTMDGNGPSGITLDFTKSQIFFIDFEWLGVGTAACGFVVNRQPHYVHFFHHANSISGVYMSTPNLPIRYWISNDGTGAASTIEHICSTVISEGGTTDLGIPHADGTHSAFINANTVGTRYAVAGIRLKSGNLDGIVKITGISMMVQANQDYHWELIVNPTVTGSPSWGDHSNSVVQFAEGDTVGSPSATTITGGHIVDDGYVKGGAAAGDLTSAVKTQLRMGAAIDGTPDEIWLAVIPLAANADIYGGLKWTEIS